MDKNVNLLQENVFLMNLDSRPDRLQLFNQEAERIGFKYERVVSTVYVDPTIVTENMLGVDPPPHNGAKGCHITHNRIVQMAKGRGLPYYTVFEDDALFNPEFNEKVKQVYTDLPDNWDVLFFGCSFGTFEKISNTLLRIIDDSSCMHAMVVRNTFYDAMINELNRTNIHCDLVLSKIYKNFNVFGCNPLLVTQRPSYSDLVHKNVDYSNFLKDINT